MSNPTATASLRIKTTPEQVDALAASFERLLVAAGGMVRASKALAKDKNTLAKAETKVASETIKAAGALDKETTAATKTSAATSQLASSSDKLKTAVLGSVGALVTMELAKRAVATITATVSNAVKAFGETNELAASQMAMLSESSTGMSAAFGEALVGGENGVQIFGALTEVAEALTLSIEENSGSIQSLARGAIGLLLEVAPVLIDTIAVLVNTINVAKLAFMGVEVVVYSVTEAAVQLTALLVRGLIVTFAAVVQSANLLMTGLSKLAGAVGLGALADGLQSGADAMGSFAAETMGLEAVVAEFAANSRAGYATAMTEYGVAARETAQSMVGVTNASDNLKMRIAEISDRFEAGTISAQEFAEEVERASSGSSLGADLAQADLTTRNTELLTAYQAALAMVRQEEEQRLAAIEAASQQTTVFKAVTDDALIASTTRLKEAMVAWQGLAGAIGGTASATVQQFAVDVASAAGEAVATQASFGETLVALSLKTLGGLALQIGAMMIAVGAGASALPMIFGIGGPAAIAAGVALTAIGAGLSALGGNVGSSGASGGVGGGGSSSGRVSAPTAGALPPAVSNSQTYVQNSSVSFGWVGDPEAAASMMQSVNQSNQRLGYT